MKKILLIFTGMLIAFVAYSQVPQAFKYQAVVRDNSGNLMIDQSIDFQVDILQGSVDGTTVYSETHSASSNAYGLVNLEIGSGTTTDEFSEIDWGADSYFIKLSVNGDEMGTSQLLSVPYALHAETAENVNVPGYTATEILALTPEEGDAVINTSESNYQIYLDGSWVAFQGSCWPEPTAANAGSDQIISDGTIIATLSANTPETNHGTGSWSIISGEGGSFADANNPNTTFTGQPQTEYTLRWTISTTCNSSYADIKIGFGIVGFFHLTGGPVMVNGKSWVFSPTSSEGDGIYKATADLEFEDPIPDGILGLIGLPSEYEDEFTFVHDLSYTHDVKNDSSVTDIIFAVENGINYRPSLEDVMVLAPFTPEAATFTYTEETDLTLEVTSEDDSENSWEVTWPDVNVIEIEGGTEFVGIRDFTRKYIVFDIEADHLQIGMFISTTGGSKMNYPSHVLIMTLIPKQ